MLRGALHAPAVAGVLLLLLLLHGPPEAAAALCTGCLFGTVGECIMPNGQCFKTVAGTCTHPDMKYCADKTPPKVVLCSNCLPVYSVAINGLEASPGPCKHLLNNLCFNYQSQTTPPSCPVGSALCAGTANALAKSAVVRTAEWGKDTTKGTLSINVGETVEWAFTQASGMHTITSGVPGTPDGLFRSGQMGPGLQFYFVFTAAGSYPYFSESNPALRGTITVTAGKSSQAIELLSPLHLSSR